MSDDSWLTDLVRSLSKQRADEVNNKLGYHANDNNKLLNELAELNNWYDTSMDDFNNDDSLYDLLNPKQKHYKTIQRQNLEDELANLEHDVETANDEAFSFSSENPALSCYDKDNRYQLTDDEKQLLNKIAKYVPKFFWDCGSYLDDVKQLNNLLKADKFNK